MNGICSVHVLYACVCVPCACYTVVVIASSVPLLPQCLCRRDIDARNRHSSGSRWHGIELHCTPVRGMSASCTHVNTIRRLSLIPTLSYQLLHRTSQNRVQNGRRSVGLEDPRMEGGWKEARFFAFSWNQMGNGGLGSESGVGRMPTQCAPALGKPGCCTQR